MMDEMKDTIQTWTPLPEKRYEIEKLVGIDLGAEVHASLARIADALQDIALVLKMRK